MLEHAYTILGNKVVEEKAEVEKKGKGYDWIELPEEMGEAGTQITGEGCSFKVWKFFL